MKVLLTGASGQLGQEIVQHAGLQNLCQMLPFSRSELDITDATVVNHNLQTLRPDVVINTAAYTKVDLAESEPERAFAVNVQGAANLAQACAALHIPLISFSTDYIFDGTKPTAYMEADAAAPMNSYGKSKWEGEEVIRKYCPRHIILRLSWLYGLYGPNFVKTMLRLAQEKTELKVVADQIGFPTATLDVANALHSILPLILQQEKYWGTYHFTSGNFAVSWHAFAENIIAHAKKFAAVTVKNILPIATIEYPTPAKRPMNSRLAYEKIYATFALPICDWRQTLPDFVRSCIDVKK